MISEFSQARPEKYKLVVIHELTLVKSRPLSDVLGMQQAATGVLRMQQTTNNMFHPNRASRRAPAAKASGYGYTASNRKNTFEVPEEFILAPRPRATPATTIVTSRVLKNHGLFVKSSQALCTRGFDRAPGIAHPHGAAVRRKVTSTCILNQTQRPKPHGKVHIDSTSETMI